MEGPRKTRLIVGVFAKTLLILGLVGSMSLGSSMIGRKGGAHSVPCSSPTLTGPASVSLSETFTVAGCGFEPGAWVPFVGGEAGGCCFAVTLRADSTGRFTYESWAWGAGTYTYKALEETRNGYRSAAEWSVDVT